MFNLRITLQEVIYHRILLDACDTFAANNLLSVRIIEILINKENAMLDIRT